MTALCRPGRPRDPACDQAILDAALVVFAREGFDGLTMEAVALQAGVGKATLYRRYPDKVALVVGAVSSLAANEPEVDTGTLPGDLAAWARQAVHLLTRTVAGACVSQLVLALPRAPGLAAEHARFAGSRRAAVRHAVARAAARGEVAPDTDPELVADLLAGPIYYRHLISDEPLDDAYADEVVEAVLAGLGRSRAVPA
jgi:AcrR family transcriptional regulator